jgi:hypothetical protein
VRYVVRACVEVVGVRVACQRLKLLQAGTPAALMDTALPWFMFGAGSFIWLCASMRRLLVVLLVAVAVGGRRGGLSFTPGGDHRTIPT